MLKISKNVSLFWSEIEIHAVRAQGAGGQNVNKVSTAIHLRFDIHASSLPEFYKTRLLNLSDVRISKEGIIVIKAQRYNSREQNKEDALMRLQKLIQSISRSPKKRRATKPSPTSRQKRLDRKSKRSKLKKNRGKGSLEYD